jgi:carbamoyltransferase
MLMAKHVSPAWKDKIPAIVHVDGTARVQTVSRQTNERLYRLLKEFEALTGVPVLINTSFNVKGEPIVERPEEALECFLTTGIEYLAIHDMLISKNAFHRVLSPVLGVYADVRGIVQSSMNASAGG